MLGTVLDRRYRVERRIARGGMATVYEATDSRLNRVVALKILHAAYADDPDFATRFVREAHAAARLSHPNVVSVFDQGDDDGTLFLAMEYLAGITLRDRMREEAPMPPIRALELLEPVLSALAAAHDAGIVHRDVKPENVLLTTDGRIKVADFGLARAVTSASSTTATSGVLIGTISYLAPELVVDGTADARSDVYSTGVMLYEMLTGQKPHQGESPIQVAYKHVHEDVPPPSRLVPGIPPYLDGLVARVTARQRESRTADAKVFLQQARRVRQALQQGVYDDPELTQDLVPAWHDPQLDDEKHEDTVTVPVQAEPTGDVAEPTQEVAEPTAEELQTSEAARQQARKRRLGWLTLLVVLLLTVAAALGGWYYGIGRFMDAPDLTGMTIAQAKRQMESSGLRLDPNREFSETVPRGVIISTDPGPGDRVLRSGTIDAVVSKGKERYDMPDVTEMTEDDARDELEGRNLALGEVTEAFHERIEEGLVISASEEVDARLRRDTEIDLVVSKGREPIDVPDVVGKSMAKAPSILRGEGLLPEVVERTFHDSVPKGHVISQDPTDGTLFRNDRVELVVSKGPDLVEVPGVFGQHVDVATAELEAEGFDVATAEASTVFGLNLVTSQDPEGGSMAPRGSTVTIYIS
ncbi:MAG: Stk1 family PASTA domain-containing Ser/Thr kinase [Propionibacteriales bacterium]|nr:Stk1 family PASTA domain-containing Ser/Thr kinase [Propionibacteriales bacterium]